MLDRVSAQLAVLRVAVDTFVAFDVIKAYGILIKRRAVFHSRRDDERSQPLVVNQCVLLRQILCRIARVAVTDDEYLVHKDADVSLFVGQIDHMKMAQKS